MAPKNQPMTPACPGLFMSTPLQSMLASGVNGAVASLPKQRSY
jgi:hypothetical protein